MMPRSLLKRSNSQSVKDKPPQRHNRISISIAPLLCFPLPFAIHCVPQEKCAKRNFRPLRFSLDFYARPTHTHISPTHSRIYKQMPSHKAIFSLIMGRGVEEAAQKQQQQQQQQQQAQHIKEGDCLPVK